MIISAVQSFDVVQAAGSVGHGDCNSCGAGQVRPGTRLPEVLVPILYGTLQYNSGYKINIFSFYLQ